MRYSFIAYIFFLCLATAQAQTEPADAKEQKRELIQFSGMILTDDGGRLVPVPYATVHLPEKKRGTYSDYRGFFSLVVEKGDKVRFNCVGLEPVILTIPDTLTRDRYSMVQLMVSDPINLAPVVIFPWPSKEHFKIEFLKMDVTPELQRLAAENLANEYMIEARKSPDIIAFSGKESSSYYLRQQSREYLYIGQTPPMNIFSPIAWGQFFSDWKQGKFKKKKN